ncbi:MAG: hypothetical protein GKR95_12155 [Gammaproteobacteria bacterium]|nr:hypothetical protein [Gammaproteobacteria bacterium]
MQQEVTQFFAAGFSHIALISYGFIQLIGAMLLVIPVTRPLGALIVAVCFGISALVFLPSGKIMAPLFSMIGVILAGYVAKLSFTNPGKN